MRSSVQRSGAVTSEKSSSRSDASYAEERACRTRQLVADTSTSAASMASMLVPEMRPRKSGTGRSGDSAMGEERCALRQLDFANERCGVHGEIATQVGC